MTEPRVHFTLFRGSEAEGDARAAPRREVQELWFSLARTPWSSLVFVPGDEGISADALALEFADFGGRIRGAPVTAIVAESVDYQSARMLAELQTQLRADLRDGRPPSPATAPQPEPVGAPADGKRPGETRPGGVVIALQPLVREPLGVNIALHADLVLLCVAMRKTRMSAARRTLELVGADRVGGVLLL
jgi:hypothetical protein